MLFIIIGCLAFLFLYIFDINKVKFIHKNLNICFAVGVLLLAFSTIGILFHDSKSFEIYLPLRVLFGVLSIIALVLMLHALFYSLPFKETYIEVEKRNKVIDTGMYALSRHPGVLWFFLFYFFLWLAWGKMIIMWAGIVWTIMDIIHVYVQDRWLFPKALIDYDKYKDKVPFLIPSIRSIKQFMMTIK